MTDLLFTDAHVLDPAAGQLTDRSWVRVESGRIVAVDGGTPPSTPDGVRVVPVGGRTLLPGLIDGHAHATAVSADLAGIARWSPAYVTAHAARLLRDMLHRGFTTIRDVGGADFGLADAVAEGLFAGPRIVFGGKALSPTGGHGDGRQRGEDVMPHCYCSAGLSRIADGVTEVRVAARDELRRGASHIKIMLSGGIASPTDRVDSDQYSIEEIRAVVEETALANRYVTGHAYHARSINRGLANGVRCIEHGNHLDERSIELFLANDAFLVPTLVTYQRLAADGARYGLPEESQRKVHDVLDAGLGALERAHRAGVSLVYGTDLLGAMQVRQLDEFRIRAEVQPAADILRAATTTAARLLGEEGEVGVVAPGARADLLVVDGDPLADIGLLADPERCLMMVVKGGVPYVDRLG